MAEVLKTWIRDRLGVLMNMTPELFGYYTRDGRLLAQILHSYGIINSDQLETIMPTRDATLCRVNLKHLRVWLRFIGVEFTDHSIEEISCGKGTTALQLFYKLYLSLEDKDSLHFITLQKEREKYIPTSRKFDVIPVPEDPPPYEPPDHPLSKSLKDAASSIEWYRGKYYDILQSCQEERKKLEASMAKKKKRVKRRPVDYRIPYETKKHNVLKDLDEFAQKHRVKRSKRDIYDPCRADKSCSEIEIPAADPEAAKAYISWLKTRRRKETTENAVKSQMQNMLLSELWEKLSKMQEENIDESLARRVLDQSHYEKQMMTKLNQVRQQKDVITENRKIVDQLMLQTKESKIRLEQDRTRQEFVWEAEDIDMEYQRLCELHRRILKEKFKKLREKHERICLRVLQDLVDIAVKAAEYRASNEGCVPKAIWNEWKALFLKCQPIFVPDRDECAEEEEGEGEEEIEEIVQMRLEREEALNEADFESYHTLGSPWDEYVPPIDDETEEILRLGELVLGYIVHRLLEFVYPYPVGPVEPPMPKVKVSAVILGIVELSLCKLLQTLLRKSGICVVTMEDAINYCLLRYKEEMSDVKYIDANIIRATEEVMKRSQAKRVVDSTKKVETTARSKKTISKSSKTSLRRKARETAKDFGEKETQTPRVIPYDDMDPVLSDAAYVGKWTYEFLVLGQPISNELNTRILVEYLKSLGEVEGWALIDYPNTYDQMSRLEFALTGRKVPPDPTTLDFDSVNIEEIDPVSPRIVYEDAEVDDYASYRQSKLLPNPINKEEDYTLASTFVTTYVRAIPKPKNLDVDVNQLFEVLPEDSTALDKFYSDQSVAYVVYYDTFDLPTVKKIARLVTGDKCIPRTPSMELFGDVLKTLEELKEWKKFSSKESMVRRLLSKSTVVSKDDDVEDEEEMKMEDIDAAGDYIDYDQVPKPGQDGWNWLDLPQHPVLLDALATLWENLEEIYIFDLMEIFSLKRIHSTAVIPYKDFVVKNMKEFVERPDTKQNLLHEFQSKFNDVSEDIRDDEDVKCELHCRLAEFQHRLWDICDLKRQEAEEERKRIIREKWTDVEAVLLVNIYMSILQAEIDRCVDTLQMIQDYYISMLQKPIQESRFSKMLLGRVKIHVVPSSEESKDISLDSMIKNRENKDRKDPKSKAPSERYPSSLPFVDPNEFSREIAIFFVDVNDSTFFDPTESSICKAILDNVEHVRSFLESIATIASENLKKEETAATMREKTTRRGDLSADTVVGKLATRGHDLVEEWRYASLFEINRMRVRLDVLAASARVDVAFLLDTMRLAFHRIYHQIIERYEKEKNSIDEMIKVFGYAIEEEIPIQEEFILQGENFYVRSSILMYPDKQEPPAKPTREAPRRPSEFRISQLGRLMNVFKVVAPGGTLTERSLVYILQDMISYNMEEDEEGCDGLGSMPVPFCWRLLRSCDVPLLVERIFGRVEYYIDWREFIIHAMDLPTPTQEDILQARDHFRMLDPELKEIVTRDQYRSVPLWFFDYANDDMPPEIKYILYDDFRRSFENLFEEEIDFVNPNKLLGATISEKVKDYVRASRASRKADEVIFNDESEEVAEEALRLILAKELLCQMYLTDRYSLNYTALLLAFCKDEDPREGLGKALSLSIGGRVCTDVEEGEKYVEKLLEERRLAAELESMRDLMREEALRVTEDLINVILDKVMGGVIIEEVGDESEYGKTRKLVIEKLDGSGEVDPSMLIGQETMQSEQISDVPTTETDDRSVHEVSSIMMHESYQEFREKAERVVIYWLPYDVCLVVLSATLPWHASQPDLFQTKKNLRQLLRDTFKELYDEEVCDDKDTVLSHRFLNHDFVRDLLESTSKFTVKRLGSIFSEIIEEQDRKLRLV